jgi:glyoxylase-like metal-dependent hydrolase (beta-lactamase superfamily II)
MYRSIRLALLSLVVALAVARAPAHAQSPAAALLQQSANAMGGLTALRALKTQVIESEGKQFDSSSTPQPLGPTRQITTFRYTLTRDLTQPRLRLQWEGQSLESKQTVRWVETIDGSTGMLQEGAGRRGEIEGDGAKPTRLHPGRLATRLREEQRNPPTLILGALNQKSLRHRGDAEVDGKRHAVVSFTEGGDEFRIYIDAATRLPAQTEILEDDPLEGDSSYTLRYDDWRKVDGVMLPFSLRYELNGRALQEEQIKSIRNNAAPAGNVFAIPESVRSEKTDVKPIASQWILRRVAGGVSYQDMGRPPEIQWVQLAPGVHKIQGSSHATILVEMRDYLVAVEGPLYEERTAPVIKSIKERFPGKPIRYAISTHHHLDHAGGIRAFMAEGATIVVPFNAQAFYSKVARAPHTRNPDSLERNKNVVTIEAFGGGPRVISDGAHQVEVIPLPLPHADDLVVIYLPKERLLIEADHVSPRDGQVRPGPRVNEFVQALDKLKLDVATIVGIHGDQASLEAARAAAKK